MTSTSQGYERRIVLAGASNFRDLGGYETADGHVVRWRRVFRSDALHDLTLEDVEALVGHGVRQVFDLRSAYELELFSGNPLIDRGVLVRHTPMVVDMTARRGAGARLIESDDPRVHAEAYLELIEQGRASVRLILDALCEAEDGGTVFHCTGGRDRTGMVAALLLSVLGVPRPVIAEDYALTTEYLSFPEARIARMRELFGDHIRLDRIPPTHAHVMEATLAEFDERYGSPAEFLIDSGVSAEQQALLRHMLLEGV
jgi:protein-tyrosine phosphatase